MIKIMPGLMIMAILVLYAASVKAATHWDFSASLRYLTFWSERDAGRQGIADFKGGGADLKRDSLLDWRLQGNSRIKMHMRSDKMQGYVEVGYKADLGEISAREFWGRYNFNDKAYIIVGQQIQLFTQYVSNQVWDGNLSLGSVGAGSDSARPKITLGYGGFAFALAKPYDGRVANGRATVANNLEQQYAAWAPDVAVALDVDIDAYFPQLQASYEHVSDAWRVRFAGAYQYIKINKVSGSWESPVLGTGQAFSAGGRGVNSWLMGVEGDIDFGPLRLAGALSAGQNWSDARWSEESSNLNAYWTDKYMSRNLGVIPVFDDTAPITGGKVAVKWKSTTSAMAAFSVAYRLTEALRLETGIGYRFDRNDAFSCDGHIWTAYLQASYTITPGFRVIPEIGYMDLGKHVRTKNDMGDIMYAGAQWRMDF